MRIALCNEVIAPMPFPAQCEYAAKLGYDGLEVAPYTLSEEPQRMGAAQIAVARAAAEEAGIAVTGLHWLLVKPAGLSISSKDAAVRKRTLDVMYALVDLCAALGGRDLVHGSPQQRRLEAGETRAAATARARECFAAVAERMGLSAAMTSKHVQHIEAQVGARLLNRTSRNVSLTAKNSL